MQNPIRLAIVGDSHTQVLGPILARMFRDAGVEVVRVTAKPGWSLVRYLRDSTFRDALRGANVALVLLGGNDDPAAAPAAYGRALRRAVTLAKARGVRLVWVGPFTAQRQDVDARHLQTTRFQRTLLPKLGVTWIDGRRVSRGIPNRTDGVHFSRENYARMAERIFAATERSVRGGRLRVLGEALLVGLGAVAVSAVLYAFSTYAARASRRAA